VDLGVSQRQLVPHLTGGQLAIANGPGELLGASGVRRAALVADTGGMDLANAVAVPGASARRRFAQSCCFSRAMSDRASMGVSRSTSTARSVSITSRWVAWGPGTAAKRSS
jgi:hypothetical protein